MGNKLPPSHRHSLVVAIEVHQEQADAIQLPAQSLFSSELYAFEMLPY